jgi:site-specific recombinase XerD
MNMQLFSRLDLDVPYAVDRTIGTTRVLTQLIPSFPFLYWPDGKPCDLLNMYFLDIAHTVTGNTLCTYASQLSHIVRYCYERKISLIDLNDYHIKDFVNHLLCENGKNLPNGRSRNNNSIRAILSRTIQFLFWYQNNLALPFSTPLIGTRKASPRICVTKKKINLPHLNRVTYVWMHRSMPERESVDPKHPIAEPIIESIERAIDKFTLLEAQSEPTLRRYRANPALFGAQLEYLRCRRHFCIWLMRRTGLRPAEMVEISVEAHSQIMKEKELLLPTKKRRRKIAPIRRFPITLTDSAVFLRYREARAKFIRVTRENGHVIPESDSLLLGINGLPIKKGSLEREFSRLTKLAGFESCEACLSMFRHRFITLEVVVHIREFIVASGKTRQMMTDVDYVSILERVAAKTGHGSPRSLWHYVDLAWKQMDVWGNVDRALARLRAGEKLFDELLALKFELERSQTTTASELIDSISGKLGQILGTARGELELDRVD